MESSDGKSSSSSSKTDSDISFRARAYEAEDQVARLEEAITHIFHNKTDEVSKNTQLGVPNILFN